MNRVGDKLNNDEYNEMNKDTRSDNFQDRSGDETTIDNGRIQR